MPDTTPPSQKTGRGIRQSCTTTIPFRLAPRHTGTITLDMGNPFPDAFIAFMAFRYALARDTTAPGFAIPWIIANWEQFSPHDREQMQREIREHLDRFERCDKALPLSADDWQKVLALTP